MTLGEMVKEARESRGLSYIKAGRLAGCDYKSIIRIEEDNPSLTHETAEVICKALDISYPLDSLNLKHKKLHKYVKKEAPMHEPDAVDRDAKEARALGISYGEYCAYRDTGYLGTFIKRETARKRRESKRKVNVIESHIIGGEKGKKTGIANETEC